MVGTMSEVLNVLRLMMSRLGSHLCPIGHPVAPSIEVLSEEIVCAVCGVRFEHPSAESFAFHSYGACPACQGLGMRSEAGATIIVIDHDLDLLAAADHIIDMGPGGGPDGGHIVAAGTSADVFKRRTPAVSPRSPAPRRR
jgi:excinuclease UvrABC ATPase subunit